MLLDEVRAGGRIPLIIGRGLTERARKSLGLSASTVFKKAGEVAASTKGFTLAQKMVGKACGVAGIRPNTYCEPYMTTVGSQDTTGPMTRDELKDLACLGFFRRSGAAIVLPHRRLSQARRCRNATYVTGFHHEQGRGFAKAG